MVLRDYPAFQLIIITELLFASQVLLLVAKPFATPVENAMSLFNELMASLYLYVLYTLTDFMGRNEVKEDCGLFLLMLVLFTILVNILKVTSQGLMMINCKRLRSKLCKPAEQDKVIKLMPIDTQMD